MFREAKVDVRLHEYQSFADCDTALENNVCHVAYTDLFQLRVHNICDSSHVLTTFDGQLCLMSARGKRIRTTKNLKERMVALNRHGTADYWSDQIVSEAGFEPTDIYRPQINDIRLRTTMLCDELVDAAILPEPYATWAELKGHRRITNTKALGLPTACLAMQKDLTRDEHRRNQVEALTKVYKAARQAMRDNACADSLRSILMHQYTLPGEVADSLTRRIIDTPDLFDTHTGKIKGSDIDIVNKWWTKRHSYN